MKASFWQGMGALSSRWALPSVQYQFSMTRRSWLGLGLGQGLGGYRGLGLGGVRGGTLVARLPRHSELLGEGALAESSALGLRSSGTVRQAAMQGAWGGGGGGVVVVGGGVPSEPGMLARGCLRARGSTPGVPQADKQGAT